MRARRGFTLVELLVTMAIIGLLTGLLVTNVSRSLSNNKLADDVTLLGSKVEQIRLLAGSTQQSAATPGLQVDPDSYYYAIRLAAGPTPATEYAVVKISRDLVNGTCAPDKLFVSGNFVEACLVQRVQLSGGVTLSNPSSTDQYIAFRAPTKQLTTFALVAGSWQEATPVFPSPFAQLTFKSRTATVNVDSFSGKITATYNQ